MSAFSELQLPGLESETCEPFAGACPGCGEDVLAVEVDGREVVVEVWEVTPEHRCPLCAQVEAMGHRRAPGCLRCGGTGKLGEPYPLRGVAVAEDGSAREFSGVVCAGEAVMRYHACLADAV